MPCRNAILFCFPSLYFFFFKAISLFCLFVFPASGLAFPTPPKIVGTGWEHNGAKIIQPLHILALILDSRSIVVVAAAAAVALSKFYVAYGKAQHFLLMACNSLFFPLHKSFWPAAFKLQLFAGNPKFLLLSAIGH